MRPARAFSYIALCLLLVPMIALAQWAPNGVPMGDGPDLASPLAVSDGVGGAFIRWVKFPEAQQHFVRIDADGRICAGWPSQGLVGLSTYQNANDFGGVLNADGSYTWAMSDYYDFPTPVNFCVRVRPDGTVYPGWENTVFATNYTSEIWVVPTLQGGNQFFWTSQSGGGVLGMHFDSLCTLAPGQPAGGSLLVPAPGDTNQEILSAMPCRGGGAFLLLGSVFGYYQAHNTAHAWLTRIGDDGAVDTSWGGGHLVIAYPPADVRACAIASDDSGGAYIAWRDLRAGVPYPYPQFESYYDIYLQHITSDAHIAPGWPASGLPICTSPNGQSDPRLVCDGVGGVFVAWGVSGGQGFDVHATHVAHDGTFWPGWPIDGKSLFRGLGFEAASACTDGEGGMFVSTESDKLVPGRTAVLIQHVDAFGQFAQPWSDSGYRLDMTPNSTTQDVRITPAGPGAAIATWSRVDSLGGVVLAQKVLVDGVVATTASLTSSDVAPDHVSLRWNLGGSRAVSVDVERRDEPDGEWHRLATIRPDGDGALAFEDRAVTAGSRYAYRLSWLHDARRVTSAETEVRIPAVARFALAGARPNPARSGALTVAFSLAERAPAALELYDVSGRRVLASDVSDAGAGEHVARLQPAERLNAGLYWLRLAQGKQSATTRVIILE